MVAYWNAPAAVMLRSNCLIISGMITPTESVVIANIINMRKVSALMAARLPPDCRRFVPVGIDNRRAGYVVTEHLILAGAKRPVFLCRPGSAPTVDARIAGFREAVTDRGLVFPLDLVQRIDPCDPSMIQRVVEETRTDAIGAPMTLPPHTS